MTERHERREAEAVGAYDASTYGERIAPVYDDPPRLPETTTQAVDFLSGLAGGGPILELGIGPGRLARPLQAPGAARQLLHQLAPDLS